MQDVPIEPLTYVAPDGDTCIHVASHRGNLRAVELLIKAGVDVNRQGDMGSTPLHYAATPEVAFFLIASGASITCTRSAHPSAIRRGTSAIMSDRDIISGTIRKPGVDNATVRRRPISSNAASAGPARWHRRRWAR